MKKKLDYTPKYHVNAIEYVPPYIRPEIIIQELYDIIYAQEKEIERLNKEHMEYLNRSIKHSEAMMANTVMILLDPDKHRKGAEKVEEQTEKTVAPANT